MVVLKARFLCVECGKRKAEENFKLVYDETEDADLFGKGICKECWLEFYTEEEEKKE